MRGFAKLYGLEAGYYGCTGRVGSDVGVRGGFYDVVEVNRKVEQMGWELRRGREFYFK